MRTPSIMALAAALALLSSCRIAVEARRQIEVDVPLTTSGPVALDIETRNGRVTVEEDPSVVHLEITADCKASASSLEMARERLAAFDVSVEVLPDGTHRVRPQLPGGWRSNDGVSLRIVVPEAGATSAHSSNGRLTVVGAEGGCTLDTTNGRVEVVGSAGWLEIDTSNASVTITDHAGPFDARTSNASIDVTLSDLAGAPFHASTSNGSIDIEIGSDWEGQIVGSTSNGSLRHREHGELVAKTKGSIRIQRGTSDDVSRATTSNGSVTIEVR